MELNPKPIRILIADDHTIFRDGLRRLLESEPGFEVVGEAAGGDETIELVRKLNPDILLLDLAMPEKSGLEVLRMLAENSLSVRTILLTALIDRDQIVEALRRGARGIVLKESATQLLMKSIQHVLAGQYWVAQDRVADLVEAIRGIDEAPRAKQQKLGLTARELEIIAAVVSGSGNREIAAHLAISEQTVKNHLSSIFDKLGVSNRLELAMMAVKKNLVP